MSTRGQNYRQQVTDFYLQYNPAKVGDVDAILESFKGNEELMMHALHDKYAGGQQQQQQQLGKQQQQQPGSPQKQQPQQFTAAPPAAAVPVGNEAAEGEEKPTTTAAAAHGNEGRNRARTSVNVSWHHGPVTSDIVESATELQQQQQQQLQARHNTYPGGVMEASNGSLHTLGNSSDSILPSHHEELQSGGGGGVADVENIAHAQHNQLLGMQGSSAPQRRQGSGSPTTRRRSMLDQVTTQPEPDRNFTSILIGQLSDQLKLLEERGALIGSFDPVSLSKLQGIAGDPENDPTGAVAAAAALQGGSTGNMDAFISAVTNFQNLTDGFVQLCQPLVQHLQESEDASISHRTHTPQKTQINRFVRENQKAHYRFETSPSPHGGGGTPSGGGVGARDREGSSFFHDVVQSDRRVVDVVPIDGEMNVVSEIIATQCGNGDVVMLHPGTYHENILVTEGQQVEIRPAVEGPSGRVVILPCDTSIPVVQVNSNGALRIDGLTIADSNAVLLADKDSGKSGRGNKGVNSAELTTAQVPLLSFGGDSRVEVRNVAVTGGNGGAFVCHSASASFTHCIFSRCVFAAIYSKDSAHVSLAHSSLLNSEVGLRIKHTSFALNNSQIRACTSNGIALHGTVKGVIENANITRCSGSAILLSPASEVLITSSSIRNNAQYGIYAPSGADFVCTGTEFADNGVSDYSRPPPLHTSITTKQ